MPCVVHPLLDVNLLLLLLVLLHELELLRLNSGLLGGSELLLGLDPDLVGLLISLTEDEGDHAVELRLHLLVAHGARRLTASARHRVRGAKEQDPFAARG